MRKHLVVLLGLSGVAAAGIASADLSLAKPVPAVGAVNADTADLVPVRKRLAIRSAAQEKFLAVAKADPRTAQAKADLATAVKITDEKQRKAALKATATKWQAYRSEMLKKANIDADSLKAQVVAIPLMTALPPAKTSISAAVLANAPTVLTATSFTEQFTYKKDCQDGSDTWKFYGENTEVHASSMIADNDCGKVSAGRGARFELPAGVKKVEVTAEWVYDLDVGVLTYGVYGRADASTGLRIESLAGYPLTTIEGAAGLPTMSFPVRADSYYTISAECSALPWCEDSNSGTAKKTVSFPIDKPGAIIVTPYVSTGADADLHATASGKGLILDVKSISVKVYK